MNPHLPNHMNPPVYNPSFPRVNVWSPCLKAIKISYSRATSPVISSHASDRIMGFALFLRALKSYAFCPREGLRPRRAPGLVLPRASSGAADRRRVAIGPPGLALRLLRIALHATCGDKSFSFTSPSHLPSHLHHLTPSRITAWTAQCGSCKLASRPQ